MNSVQLHLALTHVPVILSLIGLALLITAFLMKNIVLIRTSYIIILLAGIAAIPVFFTGEGTEEAVENLAGVSEDIIHRHEGVAKFAMISIAVAGCMALIALFFNKLSVVSRISRVLVLLTALISGGLMIQTAHLGGQIRHSEIRNGVALQNGNESGDNEGNVDHEQNGD